MVLLKSFDIAGLLAREGPLYLVLVVGVVMVIAQSHLSGTKSSIPMGVYGNS